MTEQTTETETEAPEVAGDEQAAETEETGKGPNAEAARYRRQLRETETERDGLRGTLERLQRAEVHRLAADQLAQPDDVFDVGRVELADLLDDDGNVDEDLLATAIHGLVTDRPGLARTARRQKGPVVFGHSGGSPAGGGGSDWQSLIQTPHTR